MFSRYCPCERLRSNAMDSSEPARSHRGAPSSGNDATLRLVSATQLTGNAAVKPEGGLAVAEQLGEGRLRVVDPRESLHLQLELRAAGHAIARHARGDTAPAGPPVRANRPSLGVELAGEVAEVG